MKIWDIYRTELNKNNPECRANASTAVGMTVGVLMIGIIWFLNVIRVFVIDDSIMTLAFIHVVLAYCAGMILAVFGDLSKKWMKYVLLSLVVFMATSVATFMTYHAVLAIVFPIVCASMYSSKRVMLYTYGLSVVGIVITVFVGYYHGVCDANMVLLTNKTLDHYITAQQTFGKNDLNQDVFRTLLLYYVIPRSMCVGVIAFACNSIGNILKDNMSYAHEMKLLAEIDEMTGVYNKSKYMTAIEKDYIEEAQVAVVFWDINNLKEMNDSQGHERGDKLIRMVANSIMYVTESSEDLFRTGGDEFVLIMRNADEEKVLDLLKRWRLMLDRLNVQANMVVSASYGYACGNGKNLQQVIHEADQMMYEHKRKFHDTQEQNDSV